MKIKRGLRIEIKSLSEDGSFEGLLSPYNVVDQGDDVVEPGAFTKTLQEQGNKFPLLWQHKSDTPIGELIVEDRADGLYCKGQLLLDLPEAQKAYLLLKAKIVKGLSIGYEAIKSVVLNGVRHLKEIKLYEGSVVTFPMNEAALINSVKQREQKGDFTEELTEIQLNDAGYQMRCALSNALYSALWSNLPKESILEASDAIIEQFRDSYGQYLSAYLDLMEQLYGPSEKGWNGRREVKSGRKLSKATKDNLASAHDHMKSAVSILSALMDDEADDDSEDDDSEEDKATTKSGAAKQTKSEPDPLHSAAEILTDIRSLIPQA